MGRLPIVALDGPAGVGKTTLALRLARTLGVARLDTGAMYRCLALRLGEGFPSLSDEEISRRCGAVRFNLDGDREDGALLCDDRPVGDEVRTEEVGALASRIATLPIVRECMKAAQRRIGELHPLVAEGRDMGEVVFPDAAFKFFLDATPEIRAARRLADLRARGDESADLARLTEQLRRRDDRDRNRAEAPLRPAPGAEIVDTSRLDVDGVLALLCDRIRAGGGASLFPRLR
ncbi:MAG: (d)CMP kinase [Desulfovibrio sp.]|jgi:cytidylate kinase|nr:(d)CMP kinase [Desulfovibrio sp.]